jgi:DNA repair protein RadA/Sms
VKAKTQYQCQQCGALAAKWSGQCGECEAWNTLVETRVEAAPDKRQRFAGGGAAPRVQTLGEVVTEEQPRLDTGMGELNRVLGGGLVIGSVVLLGGDPGIGKTTLLLQSLAATRGLNGVDALYVSGEESAAQIALRAERLKLPVADLKLLTETDLERILVEAARAKPAVLVIDSIQTVYSDALQSPPGSWSVSPRAAAPRSISSAMSPRTAASPVHGCSSTWSTQPSISRATRTVATA